MDRDERGGEVTYKFRLELPATSEPVELTLQLDPETLDQQHNDEDYDGWTRLEYYQCPGCPLNVEKHPHCPAAQSLAEVIEKLGPYMSFEEAKLTVETRERQVTSKTSLQSALRSILGVYLATSGCPVLAKFKPMARYHLPFASRDETIFRAASAHMLAQYRLKQLGLPYEFGLDKLRKLYDDVSRINRCLCDRIRGTTKGDAHINAISLLDILAQEMSFSMSEDLSELDYLFRAYVGDQH